MSRTIQSPGIEIIENNVGVTAPLNFGGTTCFVAGFSSKGPIDEIINIGTLSEFESIFGLPTNAAERYFYQSVKPILQNSTNLVVSRLPYGSGSSAAYGSQYTALVYPHTTLDISPPSDESPYGGEEYLNATEATVSSVTPASSGAEKKSYVFGEPALISLTQDEYETYINGGIAWTDTASYVVVGKTESQIKTTIGNAALVIFNKRQTTINAQYEGFYVSVIDNTNLDPSSATDSIRTVKSISQTFAGGIADVVLPEGRLGFDLTSPADSNRTSLSKTVENLPNFDMYGRQYDDNVILSITKLRKDPYSSNSVKLTALVSEYHIASFDAHSKKSDPNGGPQVTNFLETVCDNDGVDVLVRINPNVSDLAGAGWLDDDGIPKNKVRFITSSLKAAADAAILAGTSEQQAFFDRVGISAATVVYLYELDDATAIGIQDGLYSTGEFALDNSASKVTGNIPAKLGKLQPKLVDVDNIRIDIFVEAGLSTIFAYTEVTGNDSFSDVDFSSTDLQDAVEALQTTNDPTDTSLKDAWLTIYNVFLNVTEKGRKDSIFIYDLPRWFFIQGPQRKVEKSADFIFSLEIYWAFKHLLDIVDTSFGVNYPQWFKQYDDYSGQNIWIPSSGVIAGLILNSDRVAAPWKAAAGFNRGIVSGVLDIALSTNQSQRDLLYKLRLNPVSKYPQGLVVMAENTSLKKDSAFSQLHTRRAFLLAERATYQTLISFLFEPNTSFTRARVVNTLDPIFNTIKQDDGFTDYLIVCDERNNTTATIGQRELHIKILIKPTIAIEFIVAEFSGTSQGADFAELI